MFNDSEKFHYLVNNFFFESIPDGAMLVWPDGQIAKTNQNFLQLTGYTHKDLSEKKIIEFVPNERYHSKPGNFVWTEYFYNLSPENNASIFASTFRLKNEDLIETELHCYRIDMPVEGEKPIAIILVVLIDITQKIGAVNEIRRMTANNYQNYQHIAENGNDGYISVVKDGFVIKASPKFLELSGYAQDEITGMTFDELFENIETDFSQGAQVWQIFSKYLVTKDQKKIPVKTSSYKGVNLNGVDTVMIFIYLMHDYQFLADQYVYLEKIMDKILNIVKDPNSTGVLMHTLGKNFSFANDKICEVFGYTKEEFENTVPDSIIYPDDHETFCDFWVEVLSGKTDYVTIHTRFVKKNGDVFEAEVTLKKYRDESSSDILAIIFENIKDLNVKSNEMPGSQVISKILAKLENAGTVAILIGRPGNFLHINELFSKEFGYDQNNLPFIRKNNFIPSSEFKNVSKTIFSVYLGLKKDSTVRVKLHTKNGEFKEADLKVIKVKVDNISYVVLQFSNISLLGETKIETAKLESNSV